MRPFQVKSRWIGWGLAVLVMLCATPLWAEGPRVTGSLIDPDGAPIAGGEVTVVPYRSTYARRLALLDGESEPGAVATRSDADGRFEIALPEAGMWVLRATAKGHAEMIDRLVPLLRDRQLLPIELPTAKPLTVRVVDGEGKPVADALVTVNQERGARHERRRQGRNQRSAWISWRFGRTDDEGTIKLAVATDGKRVVRVTAPGGRVGRAEHESAARVEVTLRSGTPRTVRVVDAKGKPRPGTLLAVGSNMMPLVRVDDTGEAVVVWPREDTESFELVAMTDNDHWARETLKMLEGDAPPKPFVMSLEAPTNMAGVVVSKGAGDPVPGAIVWENVDPSNHVRTDGRGRYQIALFDRPNQYLQAGAMGYFKEGLPVKPVNFSRGDGPSLRLEPGFDLRGVVVDQEEQPVNGVRISVAPLDGGWRGRSEGGAESGADGRFLLGPLRAGTALRLSVRRSGYAPASVELPVVSPGEPASDVRVELVAGQTGFGFVLDANEKPVVGANVYLIPGLPQGATMRQMYSPERQEPAHELSVADGGFTFADLGPGTYDLSVDAPGFAPVLIPGIEVAPNEAEIDLGTILMEPGAVVEGIVVDGDDRPLANTEVQVQQMAGGLMRSFAIQDHARTKATSGVDGRFSVADLSPGLDAVLSVKREGFTSMHMTGVRVPSEEPLRIVLEPAGSLSGVVVDGQGDTVEGAHIFLHPDDQGGMQRYRSGSHNQSTDAEGHFEAESIGAGSWLLNVQAAGFQTSEQSGIEIRPGEKHAPLRIVLERGAVLEGTVSGSDGEPVPDAMVQKARSVDVRRPFRMRGMSMEGTGTKPDGTYRLDGLATGLISITVEAPNYRKHVRDVEIRPGGNRLDVRLDRGASIKGQVVDGAGDPVASAQVAASPTAARIMASMMMTSNQTTAEGMFEIGGLEDGQYSVTATRDGYASATTEAPIRIAGDSVGGVVLRLGSGATLTGRVLGMGPDDVGQVQVMVMSQTMRSGPMIAQVDFEGRYRIENIGVGDWTLMAMMGRAQGVMERLTVAPSDTELTVDLDIGDRIEIQGEVLLDAATPAVGYQVMISSVDQGFMGGTGVSDARGRFRVDGLKPGSAQVTVMSPAGTQVYSEPAEIAEGRELVISIVALRTLAGRVTDAGDGTPIVDASVTVERMDDTSSFSFRGRSSGVSSGRDGAFRSEPMPPGRYRVNVQKEGYGAANATVEVAEVDVGGIELRMAPSAGVTLFVRFVNGGAVSAASVVALDAAEQVVMAGTYPAGENGRVQVSDLPAGQWTLLVSADLSVTSAVVVEAPGDPVAVAIPDGGSLSVQIPQSVGAGQSGTVRLVGSNGRAYRSAFFGQMIERWPFVASEASLTSVPVGSWTVEVTLSDGTILTGAATVTLGGRAEVVVR